MNLNDSSEFQRQAAKRFPEEFLWGVATSAFQIEGAAAKDGRGASIWDAFCSQQGRIADGGNGDVACDHYHRYAEDVALMKWLGVHAYRFSISWPRVQPAGSGAWNEAGFDFYDRLIDSLLESGIQPHITLYHWDLPQALQERMNGWQSREIAPRFAVYAKEVARRFGDRVAGISTLNEPWCVATLGHERGKFAPGLKSRKVASQVSHNLLLAHGQAIQAMRGETRTPLGIVLNHTPSYPATATEADRRAARLADGLDVRWYMDPLFRGAYPADVLDHLAGDAPVVHAGDFATIGQPLDFLGVNFYSRLFVSTNRPPAPAPGELGFTDMGWEVYPRALTEHLVRLTREYAPPPIYITENGMANADHLVAGRVEDTARVDYLRLHLDAVASAMELGADVRGYFYWSLLDNFEWDSGYTKRFGLFHVDYATLVRTAKDSAHWYRKFIETHRAATP
ncbi:GH1 family beta-glucosidase [Usitatibacter palustris]|uniref:Beta-glucosidase n=1 Tax=Usitatibacter palustris TaxID=2732487 RepID=A0A6M4H405_9PROT|nr:GH1 family beta-glucosidase [Usitatibacter palustris]QJR14065.1 Beta-glucosidase A [Usitatibacter palustris]